MAKDFDSIVIGSGFGGSVMACRLAEKGDAKILVLERGRRWKSEELPRELGDDWIYDVDEPEKQNGWIDLRFMDDMIVAQGAAVGGGSQIYANVSVLAPENVFANGWPQDISYQDLLPYYATVGQMLELEQLPDNQLTGRYHKMQQGAEAIGAADRFRKVDLAVKFDPEWSYDLDDCHDLDRSKPRPNAQGAEQGTCVHCGDCDLGCKVKAKNTLDLNYLYRAEKLGVEVRPLHVVRQIEPISGGGYRVRWDRIVDGRLVPGQATADRVVLAAGSLGSTELLLRCRDQYKTLPRLSRALGHRWSSNGDFLTPSFHDGEEINPSAGPTITCIIDFNDGSRQGQNFWIQDGGFPNVLENFFEERLEKDGGSARARAFFDGWRQKVSKNQPFSTVMPWFAQGVDAADGRLYLGRRWYWPWSRKLKLDWEIDKSEAVMKAIIETHVELAEKTGGDPWVPPTWTVLRNLATPHPLGGCNMADETSRGVTDHRGQVFGYPGLYVVDGAIIPRAIGRNPSRTIAALAERAADLLP